MRKQKYLEFKVRVPAIEGVSERDWRWYIDAAVGSWCGQSLPPSSGEEPDPQWLMACSKLMSRINVTRIRKARRDA